MKKIIKKRIVFYCPWTEETFIGAEEYDSSLSDDNILNAYHEVGRTMWCPTHPDHDELWYLKEYQGLRVPYYKIEVEKFYIEVPSFWDKVKNALR